MIDIEEKDIGKYLRKFRNLGIYIKMIGSMNAKFIIHKLKYTIRYDILKLEDKISTAYIEINLNQSCKTQISIDFKSIVLHLDGDIEMIVTIEN